MHLWIRKVGFIVIYRKQEQNLCMPHMVRDQGLDGVVTHAQKPGGGKKGVVVENHNKT